jgi:hypothetical protein
MPISTTPILAASIRVTPDALVIFTRDGGRVDIPWAQCSARLAAATASERKRAVLSPSGYGIHWPLLDEDLAVGPLIQVAQRCA